MDVPRQLLLLCMYVCAHTAPLGELHYRRSGRAVYASDYTTDYEPIMYAAIPLHGPVPVLQILSRKPLSRDRNHEHSYQHPVYARPPRQDHEYAPSDNNESEYTRTVYRHGEALSYLEPEQYSSTYAHQYAAPSRDDVTILYARPNPRGGFSYRRGPNKTPPKKTPTPSTEAPVIIRVHRHRIVRDP